jgi:hypothetical protein
MTQAAIGAHFDKALDVHGDFLTEISFDRALGFEDLADPVDFVLGEVGDLLIGIDSGAVAQRFRARAADAVNVSKADLGPFLDR